MLYIFYSKNNIILHKYLLYNIININVIKGKNIMEEINQENINISLNSIYSELITKKIQFQKETLRNLVTLASREYFDSKLKDDEKIALMLNKIINEYYNDYWKK